METYMTIEELAAYLKMAEKTIRKWVFNRAIPFHKINKAVRFRLSEIEMWVDGKRNEELGMRNEEYTGSNEQLEISNEQGTMNNSESEV